MGFDTPQCTGLAVRRFLVAVFVLVCFASSWAAAAGSAITIPRDRLLDDVRELSGILESAHPDPYANGGGKVAYHRRLQRLMRELPREGLTPGAFQAALEPFVASLGDGHTSLQRERPAGDGSGGPGGLPLILEVVEELLYVAAVTDPQYLPLIGSRLEAVEGVPVDELLAREHLRRGHDNLHHALSAFRGRGVLHSSGSLHGLVPEWTPGGQVSVTLCRPTGTVENLSLAPAEVVVRPPLRPETRVPIAGRDAWFGYSFPGPDRRLAYLWIDNMTTYREMYEYSRAVGSQGWQDMARTVYERSFVETAPEDIDEVVAAIPAATDVFRSLFREMKDAGTQTLIVDLRNNYGGNDLMVQIFLYFLVGFDRAVDLAAETATVQKTSDLLDRSTSAGLDVEKAASTLGVPFEVGDYDFRLDSGSMAMGELHRSVRESLQSIIVQAATFNEVFEDRADEALFRPARILVLSGNGTQSAGFDLLTLLLRLDAELVGVTPSQAGNCFGNIRPFRLTHSGVSGWVSTKYFEAYPGRAPAGFAVEPDHPLRYRDLVETGFDPNTPVVFAIDLAAGRSAAGRERTR